MPLKRNTSIGKRDTRPLLDVLMVECDSGKLERQGLSVAETLTDFGRELRAALSSMLRHVDQSSLPVSIEILRVHNNRDLLSGLQGLEEKYRGVRTMLVVGHANETGLQMTPDRFAPWSEVGLWFQRLKPAQVALLACKSGQPQAAQALSAALPTVRNVLAAPGLAVKPLWPWMSAWLLAKSFKVAISPDAQMLFQGAASLLTKSVVYHWNRKELRDWGAEDEIVRLAVQHLPAVIEKLLRTQA